MSQSTFGLELDGLLTWKDSTLAAYLNAPRNESVLVADQFQIARYNKLNPNEPLNVLNEVFFGFYDSMYPPKESKGPEFKFFEKAATVLRENGILERIMSKFDLNYLKPEPKPEEPKVLGLNHLGFGFKIHILLLILALIAFAIEISLLRLKSCKPISENRKTKRSFISNVSIRLEVLAEIENNGKTELNDQSIADRNLE